MILLKLILLALSLLGYCLFFHRKAGIPLEFTPLFTVTTLMVCLYSLGYVGSLEYNSWGVPMGFNPLTEPTVPVLYCGTRLLYVLGWCAGLYRLRALRHGGRDARRELLDELLNPAMVIFFAGSLLIFFPLQPDLMRHTDDIHHWGLAVKCLSIYHSFPGVDSRLFFAEYPPGVPLFHYFISSFTNFREGTLFFSHNLMLLAGTVVFTYRISWKYFYILFLIPFFAFVLQNLFMHGPRYLMVDTTLAVFLGASIHLYFSSVLTSVPFPQRLLLLVSVSSALVLTKHVGLIFAVLLYAVVFVDVSVVFAGRLIRRSREDRGESEPRPKWKFRWIVVIVLLVTPFVLSESWYFRCNHCPFPEKDLSRPGISKNVISAFRQIESEIPLSHWPRILFDRSVRERWTGAFFRALPEKHISVPGKYYEALFQQELNGFDSPTPREDRNLTTVSMTVAILALTGLLIFSPSLRGFRTRYIAMNFVLIAGAGGYLLFMLLVYLYAFDEFSAAKLASFQRYVGAYFHGWLLAVFGMASLCFRNTSPRWAPKRLAILTTSILLLYLFFLCTILVFSFKEAVDWGALKFLLYVAVYFRFVFMTMLVGLIFCIRKSETDAFSIPALCPRLAWVLLLVFILMKAEFAFRISQTPYATAVPFRAEVRECLRLIEAKKLELPVLRVVIETDDPIGDCLMQFSDSYEYELYPGRSIILETFGVGLNDKRRYLPLVQPDAPDLTNYMSTAEEWSKQLIEQKVDGLFLHLTNDRFWERYGQLFEHPEEARNSGCRFYRVVPLPDQSRVILVACEIGDDSRTTDSVIPQTEDQPPKPK